MAEPPISESFIEVAPVAAFVSTFTQFCERRSRTIRSIALRPRWRVSTRVLTRVVRLSVVSSTVSAAIEHDGADDHRGQELDDREAVLRAEVDARPAAHGQAGAVVVVVTPEAVARSRTPDVVPGTVFVPPAAVTPSCDDVVHFL